MPYNSQSPTILKLNQLFANYTAGLPAGPLNAANLTGSPHNLADRAQARSIVSPGKEWDHIDHWPADQQKLIIEVLKIAISNKIPVSFAWEEAADFETVVVMFDDSIGITTRSPRNYP